MSKLVAFICCFMIFSTARSQMPGSLCKMIEPAIVSAYFEGYAFRYKDESGLECFRMERSYFQKNFRLSLSDSSYTITRFNFTTDLNDGSLVSIVAGEEGIMVDRDSYTKQLRKLTRRSLITVDNITVSKNGQCFKVPSFICYMLK